MRLASRRAWRILAAVAPTVFLAVVVLLAIVVEGAAGFGATIVTVTLGALLLPLDHVLAAFLPLNLLLSAALVARNHPSIERAVLVRQVLPWMGVGVGIGLTLGRFRGSGWIKAVFAAFVVLLSIVELWRMRRKVSQEARPLGPWSSGVALASAGVIHGLFACGGPLVVYVVGRTLTEKAAFRATLSALWLVMNLVLVTTMAWDGSVSRASLVTSSALLPSLLVGSWAGDRLHHLLPERTFRVAVFALLLCAATVLLARSLI